MAEIDCLTRERDGLARANASLAKKVTDLERWKAAQLAVEAEWDPQALAKDLGFPPGASIRPLLQLRVRGLLVERDEARARLSALSDAHLGNAVNEAARDLPSGWMVSIEAEAGFSDVLLFGPAGFGVDLPATEDSLLSERIRLAIATAKKGGKP